MPRGRLICRRDPEEERLGERRGQEIDTHRQTRRHRPDQARAAAAVGNAVPYRRRQAGRDRDRREALLPMSDQPIGVRPLTVGSRGDVSLRGGTVDIGDMSASSF